MPHFDRELFHKFIIDNRVVGFFDEPVTLKSGRSSNWYVNWRTVCSDVFLLDRLSDFLIQFVEDLGLKPDAFYGVPEGATKLGVITTYKWARVQRDYAAGRYPLPMGRGKPKEHGKSEDRFFVGEPRGRIVVVEDVTTTGGSLIETLDQLAKIDVQVLAAIGLTNRMEKRDDGKSVEEAIGERKLRYYSLSDATAFLPPAYSAFTPGEKIARAIEEEYERYGVRKLRLL
jgi:orotate phosphoribosyltransferase